MPCYGSIMTTHRKRIEALTRQVTDLNEHAVDTLYGLEPVYEPASALGDAPEPTTFVEIQCPYCAEQFETCIDLTAGPTSYVEDCYVCCRPIELFIEIESTGRLRSVLAQRMD
jgi:hypothetical protein